MTVIEIIFSTPNSGGDYDSRVLECDEWHWGARLDVHLGGRLVAQFDAAAVLGVVDLAAVAEVEEDDEDEDEDGAIELLDDDDLAALGAELDSAFAADIDADTDPDQDVAGDPSRPA